MKIVSIILARGGSKGIPNKNIISLNGKPLISYVIKVSKKSKIVGIITASDTLKMME